LALAVIGIFFSLHIYWSVRTHTYATFFLGATEMKAQLSVVSVKGAIMFCDCRRSNSAFSLSQFKYMEWIWGVGPYWSCIISEVDGGLFSLYAINVAIKGIPELLCACQEIN